MRDVQGAYTDRRCRELVEVLARCHDPNESDSAPERLIDAFAEVVRSAKRIVGDKTGKPLE